MNIVERVNKQLLFQDFYYGFLLKELKTYINKKLNKNYTEVNEVFTNSKNFPVLDSILVESFRDVGKESYSTIFSQLDLTCKDKIIEIIECGKELFREVKGINDDSEEKYDQYYTMFELIGPFLYKSFKRHGLLKQEANYDLDVVLLETELEIGSVHFSQKLEIKTNFDRKWTINMPEQYDNNCGDRLVA